MLEGFNLSMVDSGELILRVRYGAKVMARLGGGCTWTGD
jgi:hypothetical protein